MIEIVATRQIPIDELLPTQASVGMREVDLRRKRWHEKTLNQAKQYLSTHHIPVVLGPGNCHYMIDRHHLTRALQEEGFASMPVAVIEDLRGRDFEEFWATLEQHNWAHPFDGDGQRQSYSDMPTSILDLVDDPFRSLAGALKRAGGYAKTKAPFSEFRWADFMRSRIDRALIEHHFSRALAVAMNLAQSSEALGLPGWLLIPEVDHPQML
jgi:hypothetical protein